MKKTSLILLFTLVFTLASFSFSFAEISFDLSVVGDTLTISGNTGSELPYENVTVYVVKPQGSADNVTDTATLKENLYYYNQKNSDYNGDFIFNVDLGDTYPSDATDTPPVRYTVSVYSAGFKSDKFTIYANDAAKAYVIKQVNGKTSGSEISKILDVSSKETDTAIIFNLNNDLIYAVPEEALMNLFAKLNDTEKLNPEKPEELAEKLLLASVITALNEGREFDITAYSSMLSLSSDYLSTYNTKLSETAKKGFTSTFLGSGLDGITAVQNEFEDKVILSVINNLRNRSDIEYIISNHGADMGIDASAFKSFIHKERLINSLGEFVPYSSVKSFTDKYNELYLSLSKQKPSAPSGGGGGGSSIGGASSAGFSGGSEDEPVSSESFNAGNEIFGDLSGAKWAEEYVMKLYEKGIVKGVAEKSFAPNNPIKREEYIKMIVTALEIEGETESVSFSDADENSWYYDYLCKACGAGLVNGYNDGTFGAGKNITREEMITISYRAALYKNKKFSQSSENFTDDDKISDYAKEAVYSFRTAGIISGSGNNTVNPKNNLTRAEAAKIICLLMEYGGI